MTPRTALSAALIVVSLGALTGCAGSDEAGFGLPTLRAEEIDTTLTGGAASPVSGTLAVESNGCFTWRGDPADAAWIVWPADARQDAAEVVLGSGERLGDGDAIAASGAVVTLADLPHGGEADSYFGSFGGFCDAEGRGVLVLTDVRPQ